MGKYLDIHKILIKLVLRKAKPKDILPITPALRDSNLSAISSMILLNLLSR
jgi:hypothetical protein